MVMAERDDVRTASLPVTVVDAVALSGQMLAALARLPFRRPFAGGSTARSPFDQLASRKAFTSAGLGRWSGAAAAWVSVRSSSRMELHTATHSSQM